MGLYYDEMVDILDLKSRANFGVGVRVSLIELINNGV